jgi:hypothetical protein
MENETLKHPGGRPTIYSQEMLDKAKEYINSCEDEEVRQTIGMSAKGTELFKNKLNVKIPTIEGLAFFLDVNRDTIYDWANKNPKFSDIIESLREKQANALITKGLSGDYNPTIAKVLLTKHGYREGIENTGDNGGPMQIDINKMLQKAYGNDESTPEVH